VTYAEIDRIRRAITALQSHRSGRKPLPQEHETKALDIVESVSKETGLPLEDVLAGYDPDPRVGTAEGKHSALDAMLDLDEAERERFTMIAKRLERCFRKSDDFNKEHLTQVWAIAHDQAIVEVTHARAMGQLNGSMDWLDHSWGSKG
jgi:hypothetical protein